MPRYNVLQFFSSKRVTPSSLQQDNLIQFNYNSPNGVHDRSPLVFVIEKRLDRFYGLNLHYDTNQLVELIDNTNEKIDNFLEKEWYRKLPGKRKELKQEREEFYRGLIEPKTLREFSRKAPKRDVEQFLLKDRNSDTFRCYLFKRMNAVQKMIYKIQ